MFEVTYDTIMDRLAFDGLEKIANHSGFTAARALTYGFIMKAVDNAQKRIGKEYMDLVKENKMMDENGIPLVDDKITADQRKAWEIIHEAFGLNVVKIQQPKIRFKDIDSVGLSPKQMLAIEPYLDGVEGLGPKDVSNVSPINGPSL